VRSASPAYRRCGAWRLAAVVASLTLALPVAGCGGGGDDGAAGTGGAASNPSAQPPPRVVVTTADRSFDAVSVYREASPGVVDVRAVFNGGGGLLGGPAVAEGSGFVLNAEGEIATNAHVVTERAAGHKSAGSIFVELPDRNVVPAKVIGLDPFYDIALLKVDPDGLDLEPVELGDDSGLVVGQPVATLGSPFGEQQSFSVGVVSAIDRSVRSLTQFQIEGAIQTDAAINPGNSGGPLLDAAGRVIGMNEQIETSSGVNEGVGFAIPVSAVIRSLEQLREDGEVEYAYIGVSSQALYPQLAERLGLDTSFGGLVAEVVAGGPADEAGLRGGEDEIRFQGVNVSSGGDVILSVDGRRVVEPDDLARRIATFSPGDEVTLEVLRDDQRREVEVTLGERPTTIPSG
jgi:S1-C subfamily serine protease